MSFKPSTAVLIPVRAASFSSRARRAGPLPVDEEMGSEGQRMMVSERIDEGTNSSREERRGNEKECDDSPFKLTYSPILSATTPSRPFSSTISRRTSDQGACKENKSATSQLSSSDAKSRESEGKKTHLVELVNGRRDSTSRSLGNTGEKEDTIQDLSVVDLEIERKKREGGREGKGELRARARSSFSPEECKGLYEP